MDKRKFLIRFWGAFIGFVAFIFLFFIFISLGVFGELPSFEELENPDTALATEIITTDGEVIGKFYAQNRSNITFRQLPPNLVNALLATEDIRFYEHTGVDLRALMRVVTGVLMVSGKGGGSTLTQQLAKNLFPRENLSKPGLILRKFKEWVIAVKLEKSYTKQEILAMYLNTVEFSDNAFGIKSAAQTYFGKPVDSLRPEESAVLVGMLKAPYQFNPRLHPQASRDRRNVVLAQMNKYDFLTDEEKDSLQAQPILLDYHPVSHEEGPAPYFREHLRLFLKQWCEENRKPDGNKYNIYKDGLKLYVTLDSRMQRYAEQAQKEHLTEMQAVFYNYWKGKDPWKNFPKEWQAIYNSHPLVSEMKKAGKSESQILKAMSKPLKMKVFAYPKEKDTIMSRIDSIKYHRMVLQNGFMAVDPATGAIRVWVGGVNYKYFQYDHVNKNTRRQIGSTFKPFVYTVAIRDKGYSPCFQVPNQPVTFEANDPRFGLITDWTPKNSDAKYGGMMSLKRGLANSVNTITAYLMHEMTPDAVIQLVKDMGIEAEIPRQPSICLGSADISLFEMTGAYTTYVNKGVYSEPIFITRIEDKNGNVLQEFMGKQNEVLDEQTAYVMVDLLRNVVNGGTASRLRYKFKLFNDIIGKTGTTQNYSDGWFMGATPDLVAGSWVGCDDRYIRFASMQNGQGASTALPIWGKFFQKVFADSARFGQEVNYYSRFEAPKDPITIELDCRKLNGGVEEREVPGSEFE